MFNAIEVLNSEVMSFDVNLSIGSAMRIKGTYMRISVVGSESDVFWCRVKGKNLSNPSDAVKAILEDKYQREVLKAANRGLF